MLADLRGVGIFDLFEDGECLFGVLDGLSALAELVQRQTHVPQINAFAAGKPMNVVNPDAQGKRK